MPFEMVSQITKPSASIQLTLNQDKEEYFRQLYSLNDSLDEEEDINEARNFLRLSNPPVSQSLPALTKLPFSPPQVITSPGEPSLGSSQGRSAPRNMPAILRTTSAPVTSTSAPNAPIVRKSSLLRYDISTQDVVPSPPEVIDLTSQTTTRRPVAEKSASTPNIGSVFMSNSKGIEAMLVGKRKKKLGRAAKAIELDPNGVSFRLVPEGERFLENMVIYYIPPDNKGGRKVRIAKALGFGAKWAKEVCLVTKSVCLSNPISQQIFVVAF